MNSNQKYKSKYFKYKAKFLNLIKSSNKLKGGNQKYIYDRQFGSYGSNDGEFMYPSGITQLMNGNIVVCDTGNNRIQIFDKYGKFIGKFGSLGKENTQLNHPIDVMQFKNDCIAICDSGNDRIQIFDISGFV